MKNKYILSFLDITNDVLNKSNEDWHKVELVFINKGNSIKETMTREKVSAHCRIEDIYGKSVQHDYILEEEEN